jgi:5-methylcytosine-specific restriction enzyme A
VKRNSMVQDVTQRRLYDSVRWRKVRRMWLAEHPLCAMCTRQGRTTAAVVVDHVKPHEGDHELFWDQNNYQSLCYSCHSGIKRQQERHGYSQAADANGLPMDSNHPWAREGSR